MGTCTSRSRKNSSCEKDPRIYIKKMRLLQQEISVILKQTKEDSEAYERDMSIFALKRAEWKAERKKLREEVKRLRRSLEEREERIRKMEEEVGVGGKNEKLEGESVESSANASLLLVEQMREERARRDEAVEKWKMLYLAIKNELDDLIQRTHQGALQWKAGEEEDMIEELQRELKAKDETIEYFKAQIASMEDKEYKRNREVDILRQSLRILTSKETSPSTPVAESLSKPLTPLTRRLKSLHL